MKNNLKITLLLVLSLVLFQSCSKEDDYGIPPFKPLFFAESFPEADIDFNQDFDFPGWINFAEEGTKKWIERDFGGSGYIQFSSFQSGNASNIGWAVTPNIDLGTTGNAALSFNSASNFVTSPDNKLEVFISTDFDGTNVLAATWTQLNATVADNTTNNYTYINSGEISLTNLTGNVNIAFRAKGNGTTQTGLFQVDDIKVYLK
jgi:hypothetical protein